MNLESFQEQQISVDIGKSKPNVTRYHILCSFMHIRRAYGMCNMSEQLRDDEGGATGVS